MVEKNVTHKCCCCLREFEYDEQYNSLTNFFEKLCKRIDDFDRARRRNYYKELCKMRDEFLSDKPKNLYHFYYPLPPSNEDDDSGTSKREHSIEDEIIPVVLFCYEHFVQWHELHKRYRVYLSAAKYDPNEFPLDRLLIEFYKTI